MNPRDTPLTTDTDIEGRYLDALLHMSLEAAAVFDAAGVLRMLNAGMEELFEVHQSQLVGRDIRTLFCGQDDMIADVIAAEIAWEGNLDIGFDLMKTKRLNFRIQPVFDEPGGLVGWIAAASLTDQQFGVDPAKSERLDPLTNLPDRNFLRARLVRLLEAARRQGDYQISVLCLDLDGFDRINRQFGRAVGDQVLIETARRLGRSMRASNVIGRWIEDSFIVIIPDARTHEQITSVANRLIERIARPYAVKGVRGPIILTACIGIASAPEHADDADRLIAHARTAADLAKQTGLGTYQFYSDDTVGEVKERRSIVSKLRRAIDEGRLDLVFQPKLSLVSNAIVGAEALVRWHDPVSGLIMPADFIPMAEDAGLIDPLGYKVLAESCRILRQWQDEGLPNLRIAVNVSALEVARKSFYSDLRQILSETGVEPDALELELTETSVMEGAEEIIAMMRDVRALGVHLTADDFGTGYASLSYLQKFPLDGLKIDTTFVAEIDDAEDGGGLAAAVIATGHSLGMKVVAEGVETDAQLKFLRWRQCDEVQGYLISEPLDADAFKELALGGTTA